MVNLNGTLLPLAKAASPLNNRGLNYGDALFETLRISGGKIFFWEDHYFRLMASMRILRMEIPMNFTMEFLEKQALRTIHALNDDNSTYRVKLLVWRKPGGKYAPLQHEIEYAITAENLPDPFYIVNQSKYEVELFKDHYICPGLLSTLKTNNRIINILGSIFAEENGFQNCLLLNGNKQVVEALNGNLFLVSGNAIKTPPLSDGCLNGILRKQMLSILGEMTDFSFEEASISPFELQKADELFITNSVQGIVSVTKYRKKEFGNEVAIILLAKLNEKAAG